MNKFWRIIIIAALVRIFLMMATFHPDLRAFVLGGQMVATGNIFNLYDYLPSLGNDAKLVQVFGNDLFIYPPLIYLYHGFYQFIYNLISPNFMISYLIEQPVFFGTFGFSLYLFLAKVPYLVIDFIAAIAFSRLFSKEKQYLALVLWLFNPINLYSSYMMGQFDMLAASFVVLAIYFWQHTKLKTAAIMLGFGIGLKIYPVLLLPLFIFQAKTLKNKFYLLVLSILPYVISIIGYLPSHGFRSSALVAGLTQKSTYANIPVSAGESLLLFPLCYIISLIYILSARNQHKYFLSNCLMLLSWFFVFTHFHPQWFMWISPFLLLEFSNRKLLVSGMYLAVFASLWFFDNSLTTKLFAPIFPMLLNFDIFSVLKLKLDYNYYRSLIQTLYAACLLSINVLNLKDD